MTWRCFEAPLTHARGCWRVQRLQRRRMRQQPLAPLLAGLPSHPGLLVVAKSVVPLRRAMAGREVVVLFEGGVADAPIIMGVIESHPLGAGAASSWPAVAIDADGVRRVIEAELEIVLRCGDASITLTRAGKVIIKGHYVLSRATGYNKIKGAAVDIN
jgi:Domain of unknown function (DUF6484)